MRSSMSSPYSRPWAPRVQVSRVELAPTPAIRETISAKARSVPTRHLIIQRGIQGFAYASGPRPCNRPGDHRSSWVSNRNHEPRKGHGLSVWLPFSQASDDRKDCIEHN
jgi:hypothetical protein